MASIRRPSEGVNRNGVNQKVELSRKNSAKPFVFFLTAVFYKYVIWIILEQLENILYS